MDKYSHFFMPLILLTQNHCEADIWNPVNLTLVGKSEKASWKK